MPKLSNSFAGKSLISCVSGPLRRDPIEVTQLKTLIHVAELGSLSKAADRLHIAQPALSRQIRLLEAELGVPLFERHGRGMVITEAGREVLERATRIMAELEGIRSSVSDGQQSLKGRVTIGATPTVAEIAIVPLASRIRRLHPKLSVRFTTAFTGHLLDWLQRGELDLAVSYDPQPVRSLRIAPVMVENLLLVSAGDRRLELTKPVRFRELAGMALILPSPGHSLRAIVEQSARQARVELRSDLEADSFGAMIDLVRSGFGSTILPLAPIHPLVKSGILCAAPLVKPTPVRRLVLAYPADRPVSPQARFAGSVFREIARELVREKVWIGRMLGEGKQGRHGPSTGRFP